MIDRSVHRRRTARIAIPLIAVALACVGFSVNDPPAEGASPASAGTDLRVYVVVLDGLRPEEVKDTLTPNLAALKADSTWYEQSRAVFPAETLPNHVAMMTGVLPTRNAIIGNEYWTPGDFTKYKMQDPALLGADTLQTRLETRCGDSVSTADVLSKGYLYGIFRSEPFGPSPPNDVPGANSEPVNDQHLPANPDHPGNQRAADFHWKPIGQPGYIGDPDDHVIDQTTMNRGVLPWIDANHPTPQFMFVNLGDIDRSGHVDASGMSEFANDPLNRDVHVSAFRQAALADTDKLVGDFVQDLKGSGAWQQTVLIFASDHGMDWSVVDNGLNFFPQTTIRGVNITTPLGNEGFMTGDSNARPGRSSGDAQAHSDIVVVPGGGTGAIWVEENDDAEVNLAAQILGGSNDAAHPRAPLPGVAAVATRKRVPNMVVPNPTLAEMGMDNRVNGDIVVLVKEGWAVRDGSSANPLPGNHGHPATQHNTLFVTGGSPLLNEPKSVPGEPVFDPAHKAFSPPQDGPGNLSIAPTVAALFGLGETQGGYDGPVLKDAFKPWALAAHEPCKAATEPPHTQTGTGPGTDTSSGDDTSPTTGDRTSTPRARPSITQLSVRPSAMRPRRKRSASVARRGARVRYLDTQEARTKFTVWRLRDGRKHRMRGSFRHRDVAGVNSFRFTGWLDGRRLKRGRYLLRAVARNSAGKSAPARAKFRVKRG